MAKHKLIHTPNGWICEVCQQQWERKPRAGSPRLPVKPINQELGDEVALYQQNLKGIEPRAVFRCNNRWDFLYRYDEAQIDDPTLPKYIDYSHRGALKTEGQLSKLNLTPGAAQPRAFARWFSGKEWVTLLLYHPDDCEWESPDQFITLGKLRDRFQLSQSWINRLGAPDLITENPHHKYFAPMKLYSEQRITKFLADHAQEYSEWLDQRDKFVAIFEKNREAINQGKIKYEEKRKKRKNQEQQCLQCASSCATNQGFLCAIYPLGLEDSQIPCQDFSVGYQK